jgi:hypothetical protein
MQGRGRGGWRRERWGWRAEGEKGAGAGALAGGGVLGEVETRIAGKYRRGGAEVVLRKGVGVRDDADAHGQPRAREPHAVDRTRRVGYS